MESLLRANGLLLVGTNGCCSSTLMASGALHPRDTSPPHSHATPSLSLGINPPLVPILQQGQVGTGMLEVFLLPVLAWAVVCPHRGRSLMAKPPAMCVTFMEMCIRCPDTPCRSSPP